MPHPDTIREVLVVISFVSLFGMVKRPFYGVVSYLIIMMVRPGIFYPALGAMRVELIVGLLVIIVMILSPGRLQKLLKLPSDPICKRMFLLFGVMILSMIQAFDFKTSWDWMEEFAKVFFFFLMIVTLLDTKRDINFFLWVFLVITSMIAYDAIYNFQQGIIVKSFGGERIDYAVASGGMGAGHVALANMILQAMPIMWYLTIANKSRLLKLIGFTMFTLMLYGVVISGSRGGFIGLIVLAACVVFFAKHRLLAIGGILIILLILPSFSGKGYLDYVSRVLTPNIAKTDIADIGEGRLRGLISGFEMMIKRPILGVGPGCYPVARKAWFGWGLWAHNHYGELMGELGLIGVWVWFGFLITYLKKAVKLRKTSSTTGNAIFTGVIVATIVRLVLGMGSHSVYTFFWYMVAGIVAVQMRITEKENMNSAGFNDKPVRDGFLRRGK
jgi:O-antigen ligase